MVTLVGLDFTAHLARLCSDLTARLPELAHIDMQRVALRFCQARKTGQYGIYASLTPLRFKGGERILHQRGFTWQIDPRWSAGPGDYLYLLSFYLPRFCERPLLDKISTVIHELWHISPAFDGDIRRHDGRYHVHSASQKQYDALMTALAEKWLAMQPDPQLYEFLRDNFATLTKKHGAVFGRKIATPRLIRSDRIAALRNR